MAARVPDFEPGQVVNKVDEQLHLLAMNTNERINDERSQTNQQIEELKSTVIAITVTGGGLIITLLSGLIALAIR